ncbi:MAG: ParA family protein [Alphaproteobacteria bacterium]|nr:ParA family protein [Alphaproteobacteria bacterium]
MTASEAARFLSVSLQAVHKQLKVKSLEFHKSQNRVYFGHDTSRKLFGYKFKKQIIAFQIVKGGTGKTSLAHAVAVRANLYGAKVLCIDLDQQGNLTQAFGVDAEELPIMIDVLQDNINLDKTIVSIGPGIDLIPSRIENAVLDNIIILKRHAIDQVYKKKFDEYKKKYDLIIIDCPPALGQSVAAVALTADIIIAPVTPEEFSLSGLKITSHELQNLEENFSTKIPLKLVLNKFDTRTSLSHEVLSTLIKHPIYGDKLYKSYIRASQEFPNTIANGTSIFDSLKITSAKEDIDLLTREILQINKTLDEQTEISLGRLEETPKAVA